MGSAVAASPTARDGRKSTKCGQRQDARLKTHDTNSWFECPRRLTPKQRALTEELAKDLAVDTMPEQKGFRDLLKNLFG